MKTIRFSILSAILFAATLSVSMAHEDHQKNKVDKPKIEDLMTSVLEGTDGVEVILSHVALPPNTALPKHWHPGEEFAYVLQGSITLLLEGKGEKVFSAGEVGKVPLKHIHSARSGSNGVTILVFRVHEQGKPGRVLVKE
ncbi:MAG: cupin domain-containing protein [Rhizobiaceae bacterium]